MCAAASRPRPSVVLTEPVGCPRALGGQTDGHAAICMGTGKRTGELGSWRAAGGCCLQPHSPTAAGDPQGRGKPSGRMSGAGPGSGGRPALGSVRGVAARGPATGLLWRLQRGEGVCSRGKRTSPEGGLPAERAWPCGH